MSNHVLAMGTVSLVSLLAGVAITLAFTAEALNVAVPAARSDDMEDVVGELRKNRIRLDRVESVLARELAATRRIVREAIDENALTGSRIPGDAASQAAVASGDDGEGLRAVRDDLAPLPAPNFAALQPMAKWKEDAELRKKWLFASEKTSLDAFGTPDEVTTRGVTEWWTYWNVEDGKIASEYRVKFNNGRLVQAQLVKWEKPRNMPTAKR